MQKPNSLRTQRLIKQIEDSEDLKRSARRSEHERLRKNKTVAEKELRDIEIDLSRLKDNLARHSLKTSTQKSTKCLKN